jgi:proteic killer suppression protein
MIRSFRRSGLEKFFKTGARSGSQPSHAKKLRLQLTVLNSALSISDVAKFETWASHALKGRLAGKWAISVNGNWRLVFEFDGAAVILLDYIDFH